MDDVMRLLLTCLTRFPPTLLIFIFSMLPLRGFTQQRDTTRVLPELQSLSDSVQHIQKKPEHPKPRPVRPWVNIPEQAPMPEWGYIDSTDIHRLVYNTIGDVIFEIPGWYFRNRGTPGQVARATWWGLPRAHAPVYFDGIPLYDPDTRTLDLNVLPVESVLSIHAIPAFSSEAAEGTLKIRNTMRAAKTARSRVFFHKGPGNASDTDVLFYQMLSPQWMVMANGAVKGYSGPIEIDSYMHHRGHLKINYKSRSPWDVTYALLYNRIRRNDWGPKLSGNVYTSRLAHTTYTRYDHRITWRHAPGDSAMPNIVMHVYESSAHQDMNDRSNRVYAGSSFHYLGVRSLYLRNIRSHSLQVSGRLEQQWIDDDITGRHEPIVMNFGIQDTYPLFSSVMMSGNARIGRDNGENTGSAALGIWWQRDARLTGSLEFYQTRIIPTIHEQYYHDATIRRPLSLPVQIVRGVQSAIRMSRSFFSARSVLFAGQVTHPYNYVPTDTSGLVLCDVANTAAIAGLHLKGEVQFRQTFGLHFTLQGTVKDDEWYFQMPSFTGRLGCWYHRQMFENDLDARIRVSVAYWSQRYSKIVSPYGQDVFSAILPADWVLNVTGDFTIMHAARVYVHWENLLNRTYQIVYGYPMPGTTFHLGIRWSFYD